MRKGDTMKYQKWIALITALILLFMICVGCNKNNNVVSSNTSSSGSVGTDTPSGDSSTPTDSEDPSDNSSLDSEDTEPTSPPNDSEESMNDKDDKLDEYPEEPPKNINRDWTQPGVPVTSLSKARIDQLSGKWNGLKITQYKEQFPTNTASVLLDKSSPTAVNLSAALGSGAPEIQAQDGKKGWTMTAGEANAVLYLDLNDSAKSIYQNKRVAIMIDYHTSKSATAIRFDYTGANKTVKPSSTKIWTRNTIVIDSLNANKSVSGHDFALTVTGGTAAVHAIRFIVLDGGAGEMGKATLMTPKYGSDRDAIVSIATVQQFGAVGDGLVDDTAAFQAAMDYAGGLGGGTIYVPEGSYAISGQLNIPGNVVLTGELDMNSLSAKGRVSGTVLNLYYGKNDPDGGSAIVLGNGSSVQYLAFWYPEQQIVNGKAIPYSYTLGGSYVTGGVSYGADIENIALVNSYNGIKFGPKYNVLQTIRNVYGTPLNNGFFMDANADLARVQGMYFDPSYWANSGLKNAPDRDWIFNCTFNNAVAYIAERVDWTYIFDLKIQGYQTGMLFRFSSNSIGNGASNGSLYNLDIYDCYYGIDIGYMNEIGIEITNSRIYASGSGYSAAIRSRSGLQSTVTLMDCELGAVGYHVIYSYKKDTLSLSGCTMSFLGNTKHGAAIYSYQGAVSATGIKFRHIITDFYFGKNIASARLVNCNEPIVNDRSGGSNIDICEDTSVKIIPAAKINLSQASNHKPASKALVDLTGKITPNTNISSALQTAMDSIKSGGGFVYLPAGTFRLDNPITIPTGVELRGSIDVPVYNTSKATILLTNYGKNNENLTALITMSTRSGLVGISFIHDQNSSAVVPYPFTVAGNGSDIYIRNISMNSCYNGIDLATYRSDRHLVQSFSGVILNKGIVVGADSQNGIIRDVLVNPVYWGGSGGYNDAMAYAIKNAEGIVIGKSSGQLLYSTFYYAAEKGLVFRDGCKDAVSVTHGTDCADIGLYAEGNCGTISLVNYQVASWTGTNVSYVTAANTFNGTLNICGMLGWAEPNVGLNLQSGNINIRQCKMVRFGNKAIDIGKASVSLIGMHLYQTTSVSSPLIPNLVIGENAKELLLAATIFDNDPNIYDSSAGALRGPDAKLY